MQQSDFLDVTFNVDNSKYWPYSQHTHYPVKPPSQHQKATSQDDREKIIWHIMQSRRVLQRETCICTSPKKKWIQQKLEFQIENSSRKRQTK